jgi:hypothetical protein
VDIESEPRREQMAANNQGIVHVAMPGRKILCGNHRAHMAVSLDRFDAEPRQCARCAEKARKIADMKARRAAKAA